MSLTRRLSALLLAALAVVLVGFSGAMYVSARVYLHRQVTERLTAALAVLAAATEVHDDGVEWEPEERVLPLGQERGPDRLRWLVFDSHGNRLDRSRNLDDADLTPAWTPRPGSAGLPGHVVDRRGQTWRVAQRYVRPETPAREPAPPTADERSHPFVVLTVFAPLGPTDELLASLGSGLLVFSTGAWLLALLLCRRLSRQALAPLARMVASARGLDASEPGWQLEVPGTGDELDELGRAFNDLLARLHGAYERQRRFGSDASHQLRTPLTVLTGQIEVALRRERPAAEYRAALQSALGRAVQLGRIVESLLFLARAEGDAELPAGEPIDLNAWVTEHIAGLSAPDAHTRFELQTARGAPLAVRAERALLAQLLDNLLDNARKYGTPGTPITVSTAREPGAALLAVENQGPGIPAEDLSRVFDPFYRAPEARRLGTPGVGLGLAVVQRIAAAFGGTARVESGAGRGCRVEVRLPTTAHGAAASGPAGAPGTPSSTPAAGAA